MTPRFYRAANPVTGAVRLVSSPPSPRLKWQQGYRGRASLGRAPQVLRRPPLSPAGRSPAPWPPPCRRQSLPVGGGMCVSFSVLNLSFSYSDAEQSTLLQYLGLGPLPLFFSVLRPRVTNSRAKRGTAKRSKVLGPLPLHASSTGPRRAPLPPPLGPGTAPVLAIQLALLMCASRLPTGLRQRR